ncbi:MAG: flavin reductase family protein [Thermoleophilaceae bacterium]
MSAKLADRRARGADATLARDFRRALGRFASGVTVITTADGDDVHGMTANGVLSVSLEPPLVLVSLGNRCRMTDMLATTGRYGISVLGEEHERLSWHFAGSTEARLTPEFSWRGSPAQPFIPDALAHIGGEVVDAHPAGDHTLFIARVSHLEYRDGQPLVFYSGRYRNLRVGLRDDLFFY